MDANDAGLRGRIAGVLRTIADEFERGVPEGAGAVIERTPDRVSVTFPDHADEGWPGFSAELPASFERLDDFPAFGARGVVFGASGDPESLLEEFSALGLEWVTDVEDTNHVLEAAAKSGARVRTLGPNAYCFVAARPTKTTATVVQFRDRGATPSGVGDEQGD